MLPKTNHIMQVMTKGQYSGQVNVLSHEACILVSTTQYNEHDFNNRLHYHDNAHLSFVLYGGCAERKHERYERLPGMLTYYSAGEAHQVTGVCRSSKHINIEIENRFFDEYHVTDAAIRTAITKNPGTTFLMTTIYRELLSGDAFSAPSIQMLLLRLIGQTERWQGGSVPGWVNKVYCYIMDNWDSNPSLNELSAVAGVHPVHISKYFPLYFSVTLGEYLRKIKVSKAVRLIKYTNDSLTCISYACGFADQSHFSRSFLHFTGYSPAAYRKIC